MLPHEVREVDDRVVRHGGRIPLRGLLAALRKRDGAAGLHQRFVGDAHVEDLPGVVDGAQVALLMLPLRRLIEPLGVEAELVAHAESGLERSLIGP